MAEDGFEVFDDEFADLYLLELAVKVLFGEMQRQFARTGQLRFDAVEEKDGNVARKLFEVKLLDELFDVFDHRFAEHADQHPLIGFDLVDFTDQERQHLLRLVAGVGNGGGGVDDQLRLGVVRTVVDGVLQVHDALLLFVGQDLVDLSEDDPVVDDLLLVGVELLEALAVLCEGIHVAGSKIGENAVEGEVAGVERCVGVRGELAQNLFDIGGLDGVLFHQAMSDRPSRCWLMMARCSLAL